MASRLLTFALLSAVFVYCQASQPVPLVIWHGMGDTCCNPASMGMIKDLVQQHVPGIYVLSIRIGDSNDADMWNGFFKNSNDQIEMVCNQLAGDANLTRGFNVIGFSQGGQFWRALIQRCDKVKVHNFLSVGGQHQGVFGFPRCPGDQSTLCEEVRKLLNIGAYVSLVQDHLVQAEYWQDPYKEEEYREKCVFLPDINQENKFNADYKVRFSNLSNVVLVMFENDTMVQPKESEWFGFYQEGQDKDTYTLWDSRIWKEDLLGLQGLNSTGRLHLLSAPFDHLQFTQQWFLDNLLPFINVYFDGVHKPVKLN